MAATAGRIQPVKHADTPEYVADEVFDEERGLMLCVGTLPDWVEPVRPGRHRVLATPPLNKAEVGDSVVVFGVHSHQRAAIVCYEIVGNRITLTVDVWNAEP